MHHPNILCSPIKPPTHHKYLSPVLSFRFSARMSTKVEITRGVFDPRTYREADPNNAARKRRSDWPAIPGKINYVRERTVASKERELAEQARRAEEEKEQPREEVVEEPKAPEPEVVKKPIIEKKQATEFWPRKKRSDITMSRII